MLINSNLLNKYGAETVTVQPSETIFNEGDVPRCYYQIVSGRIKLNHYDEDGKEIIQSVLIPGQSVCELMLFVEEKYPVNAETLLPCEIQKISKKGFFQLLDENPDVSMDVNRFLSERLYQKFIMMQHNLSLRPDVRLIGVFNYFKSYSDQKEKYSYEIDLTRKQLASITGLRIETVIRTIKKMDSEGILQLKNSKIFY
ncbi:Crp/Fnr family transcriptional regulator [Chryseobacterium chendengshani]|uniref:Crp/Fnr family transcriptional regulator n=1 Tax=unclassified Chryseobacterium TaxID=2593645 RepID=UPI001C6447D7|nr:MULTISPECIES: Crp/Fnr family transcriptional regulator [unclassified Chryseobacterium]MBW7676373.1 Crp/Fnr family transcriptional regulator [Chryseobacterium sp. LJ756]MBW8523746.1 Crp/Fnr family transcriptional regulator [Chryseobacterium sp. LJ668]QYK16690.1 Crp/Fnr family transcriptional regulator [Chryseobacterium sp. LJ668]